jgi:hypothetical protein
LVRYSVDDSLVNNVARLLGEEGFTRVEGSGMVFGAPFFARSSAFVLGKNRLFAGNNDTYEIGVYHADGKLEELIRRRGEPRKVTQTDIDLLRKKRLDAVAGIFPPLQNMYSAMIADEPVRSTMPAFASLLVDAAGDLWVQEYPAPAAEGTEWTVFDPEGRMLGNVSMPGRFRPTQIGTDFVFGVGKDELDVEHVRMYRLEKPNP